MSQVKEFILPDTAIHKRSSRTLAYVKRANYRCENPHCIGGFNVEGHHIYPLAQGGTDEDWNIVALCRGCHHHNKLHSDHKGRATELFYWKSLAEIQRGTKVKKVKYYAPEPKKPDVLGWFDNSGEYHMKHTIRLREAK